MRKRIYYLFIIFSLSACKVNYSTTSFAPKPNVIDYKNSEHWAVYAGISSEGKTIGAISDTTSADVFYQEMGKWNGALSKAFVDNIKNITEEISCRDLCLKLNKSMLDQKLTQKPVICTSYNLNPNQLFFRKWDLNNICIRT